VLGILPFARELLRAHPNAAVALAANDKPAINDVTAAELEVTVYIFYVAIIVFFERGDANAELSAKFRC